MKYILAVDQSTSATKGMLFDETGAISSHKISLPHRQIYPDGNRIEHDPMEIYRNVLKCIEEMTEHAGAGNIAAVGITNQRETTVIWEKESGLPIANAVVWQDQRGAEICRGLSGHEDEVYERTGLPLSPYFCAAKASHLLSHVEGARRKAERGELLFGTVDSWLVYNLTKGRKHTCDYSNACRTQLFNIHSLEWDEYLCGLFNIPMEMLPEVGDSDGDFGEIAAGSARGIKIAGVIGDSHGALLGQGCVEKGSVKATYGTGSSVALNTGEEPFFVKGLSTSLAWRIQGKTLYELEGNITCTGDALMWMRDQMGLVDELSGIEGTAVSVRDNGGVYVVPAFSGLGPPYWNENARALICGLNRSSTKAHIVRAFLEQIAYQINDVLLNMTEKGGFGLKELRTDGGPTKNKFLMQFQSDIAGKEVRCANIAEISARGAAFAAGIHIGWWDSIFDAAKAAGTGNVFTPSGDKRYGEYYSEWKAAVSRALL